MIHPLLLASVVALAPPAEPEVAQPPEPHAEHTTPPPEEQTPEAGPWVLGGFVDTAYQWSNNLPDNHVWRGMFTGPRTNEITLNLAALYVRRDPGRRDPFHLELALHLGPAADALVVGEPTPGGDDSGTASVAHRTTNSQARSSPAGTENLKVTRPPVNSAGGVAKVMVVRRVSASSPW